MQLIKKSLLIIGLLAGITTATLAFITPGLSEFVVNTFDELDISTAQNPSPEPEPAPNPLPSYSCASGVTSTLSNGDLETNTFVPNTSNPCVSDGIYNSIAGIDWYSSHGVPRFMQDSDPYINNKIRLDSYKNYGNGIYADFKFEQGKEYTICFQYWASVQAECVATDFEVNLVQDFVGAIDQSACNVVIPSVTLSQNLMLRSLPSGYNSGRWEFVSITFTPTADFCKIWFLPRGVPNPNTGYLGTMTVSIDKISIAEGENCSDNTGTGSSGCSNCIASFRPEKGKDYLFSVWVSQSGGPHSKITDAELEVRFEDANGFMPINYSDYPWIAEGNVIDGWQRINRRTSVPSTAIAVHVKLKNNGSTNDVFFDDLRIQPVDAGMKTYVYDPINLRLVSELDENHYATFFEYDEEGQLRRVKKETERGVFTIKESINSSKKAIIQ